MRCISPLFIRSKKSRVFVPCGQCNYCLQTKRADWSFRLNQENFHCYNSFFLTLTYEEQNIHFNISSGEQELYKPDVQNFIKRLRKENANACDWPLRHYSVGEYGTRTSRPHYHSIIFNLSPLVSPRLTDIWSHGMCHVGNVSAASIHYVAKYVINRHSDYSGRTAPFALMSRRPGIGAAYLHTHKQWHIDGKRNHTKVNGQIGRLPRYYRDKIFSPLQREKFAADAILQSDVQYASAIGTLSKFHQDPYFYYDERVQYQHDQVKSKVNSLNKF